MCDNVKRWETASFENDFEECRCVLKMKELYHDFLMFIYFDNLNISMNIRIGSNNKYTSPVLILTEILVNKVVPHTNVRSLMIVFYFI